MVKGPPNLWIIETIDTGSVDMETHLFFCIQKATSRQNFAYTISKKVLRQCAFNTYSSYVFYMKAKAQCQSCFKITKTSDFNDFVEGKHLYIKHCHTAV